MKIGKKLVLVLTASLIAGLAVSCVTSGEYLPLSAGETITGTVQTTFEVRSSFFFMKTVKDGIDREAYIKLLEAAEKKYSGGIDIRDIIWVTGKPVDNDPAFTGIFASGKVIRLNAEE